MEWRPMQKSDGAQPQVRARLRNEGPGGLRQKNSRNRWEQKSRKTFRVVSKGGALKDPKKADRRGNDRSQEANSEGCKKIMTEKKPLGGEKKVGGAGTNLYHSEGPEGRKQETPTARENAH